VVVAVFGVVGVAGVPGVAVALVVAVRVMDGVAVFGIMAWAVSSYVDIWFLGFGFG
jgi:hypothetical protein